MIRTKSEAAPSLEGGIVAGLIGGAVMAVYLVIGAALHHADVWMPLKGAGTPFLHERAQLPGFDALAVGVGALGHLFVSVVWGLLFGALAYGLSRGATLAAGVLLGLVSWIGMFYIVAPVFGMGELSTMVPVGAAIVEHVLFGVVVALGFLPFQHRHRIINLPLTH